MSKYLSKLIRIIKYTGHKYRSLYFVISCVVITVFFMLGLLNDPVKASSGLKLYDYGTKKDFTYTDKQIMVTLNGKVIGRPQTPGILINGIAMLPYNDIFEKSDINADCKYNKVKGTISISKYGKTIQMTIGSKEAFVNGKAVTMNAAPVKIKYKSQNIAKVLVPSRFVAETLGLGYSWHSDKNTVAIVKNTMLLSYNGEKAIDYTGVHGKVTIDGKKIDLKAMPSIITNNTAMLRAKKVFSDSSIGAGYNYNSSSKTVTLTKGDKVLRMTIGSKTAYLNDNKMTLDTAPMIVKNLETGSSYVMVPGGLTAACLGYNYSWDKTSSTSKIISQKTDSSVSEGSSASGGNNSGGSNSSAPELSGSEVSTEIGTVLHSWQGNTNLYHQSSKINEVSQGTVSNQAPGQLVYVTRDYSKQRINSETFMITASAPFGGITSKKSGKQLQLLASDVLSYNQSYSMYGSSSNLVNSISTGNNAGNNGTVIDIDLLTEFYDYDISLSEDRFSLYITVYINVLNQVVLGTNTAGDYLTLTGLKPMEVSYNDSNGLFYIELPYTANSIGDISTEIFGSKYIRSFVIFYYQNKTQIILSLNGGYEYYTFDNGNQSTLLFQGAGSQKPGNPGNNSGNFPGNNTGNGGNDGNGSANNGNNNGSNNGSNNGIGTPTLPEPIDYPKNQVIPELTAPADRSSYGIILPKPAGVTASMISHVDNYFSNQFVIRLEGDHIQHFNANPIIQNGGTIKAITTSLNNAGATEIKVTTTRLQGYALAIDKDNIYIKVGNPRDVYKNIVVLDPGHGGSAKGAEYFGYLEKNFNYKILYTLGQRYFNLDTTKLKVYYTRINDKDMALSERAAFTSKMGADVFVSLHMNAAKDISVSGTEVFYSKSNNKANKAGLTSEKLAQMFINNLIPTMGTKNRGVKHDIYTVVHKNTVPAVLIELGFMSNSSEIAKLSDEAMQDRAARSIYETLLQVFELYPTGR